jgi:hypothetical protein
MQDLIIVSERLLQAPLTQAQQMTAKLPEAARAKKIKVDKTLQKIQRGEVADDVDGFLGDLIKARKWQDAKNIFVASYDTMDSKTVRSWTQVLATTQLMDWVKSLMPETTRGNIDAILRATEKMSVMRQKMLTHVAEQAKPWVDFAKDYYKGAKELARLMHYTTLEEVDPTLEPTVEDAINNDQELAEIRKKKQAAAANQQAAFEGQITKFKNWINLRLDWLDANIPGDANSCNLSTNTTFSKGNYLFYPNPVKDKLYFSSHPFLPESIEIFDASGKLIYKITEFKSDTTINVTSIANGIYYCKMLRGNAQTYIQKIVIIH